jgi:hypothetical protein
MHNRLVCLGYSIALYKRWRRFPNVFLCLQVHCRCDISFFDSRRWPRARPIGSFFNIGQASEPFVVKWSLFPYLTFSMVCTVVSMFRASSAINTVVSLMSIVITISFKIINGEENQKNMPKNLMPPETNRAATNQETATAANTVNTLCMPMLLLSLGVSYDLVLYFFPSL